MATALKLVQNDLFWYGPQTVDEASVAAPEYQALECNIFMLFTTIQVHNDSIWKGATVGNFR